MSLRHTCPHMHRHARALNPLARGFPIWTDANFLLRQRCARVRKPNTRPATRPLTATTHHEPDHRAQTPGSKSPAPAPIRPASLEIRALQLSSQRGEVGISARGPTCEHMRSHAQGLNPLARPFPPWTTFHVNDACGRATPIAELLPKPIRPLQITRRRRMKPRPPSTTSPSKSRDITISKHSRPKARSN